MSSSADYTGKFDDGQKKKKKPPNATDLHIKGEKFVNIHVDSVDFHDGKGATTSGYNAAGQDTGEVDITNIGVGWGGSVTARVTTPGNAHPNLIFTWTIGGNAVLVSSPIPADGTSNAVSFDAAKLREFGLTVQPRKAVKMPAAAARVKLRAGKTPPSKG